MWTHKIWDGVGMRGRVDQVLACTLTEWYELEREFNLMWIWDEWVHVSERGGLGGAPVHVDSQVMGMRSWTPSPGC